MLSAIRVRWYTNEIWKPLIWIKDKEMNFSTIIVLLIISLLTFCTCGVNTSKCADFSRNNDSNSNCSLCTKEGDNCYWCPSTGQCLEWDWGSRPQCSGNKYFYGQCQLNGVAIIIMFSVGLFLLLVILVCCCVTCFCCCMKYRRRRRREYSLLTEGSERRNVERQRQFQARRDEIRHKYGLDARDNNNNNNDDSTV